MQEMGDDHRRGRPADCPGGTAAQRRQRQRAAAHAKLPRRSSRWRIVPTICTTAASKHSSRNAARRDAMAYIIGSEIYGHLEKVVDRFEDVANEISGIVIENV